MLSPTVSFAAVMGLGAPELVIILIILLVLFGGSKLPGLAKGLGQSIKEFKKSSRDDAEPEVETSKPTEVKKVEPAARTHGSN